MSLVDQWGRPLRPPELKREVATIAPWSGRAIRFDHPGRGLAPRDVVRILDAAELGDIGAYMALAEDLEEMLPQYASTLPMRKRAVAQLDWSVAAASDNATDQAVADAVRAMLKRPGVRSAIFDILDAIGKGFSVTEVLWDQSGTTWSPLRLIRRDQGWFRWDEQGERLRLVDIHGDGGLVDLPPAKFIVHVSRAKSGLPVRAGLTRAVALLYVMWAALLMDFMGFAESYGQPLRVGKYPNGAGEDAKGLLYRAIDALGADAAAVISEDMNIQFVEATKSNGEVYTTGLRVLDDYISTLVLGQTLTTNVGASGSRALGDVHDRVRSDIMRADAETLQQTLQEQLVNLFVAINFGDVTPPELQIGLPNRLGPMERIKAVEGLVPFGLTVGVSDVRDLLGFGDPGPDEAVLRPAATPLAMAARAAAASKPPAGDPIAEAVDVALADDAWRPMMAPAVEPLLAALADAADYDQAMEVLIGLAARKPSAALTGALERALLAARLSAAIEP